MLDRARWEGHADKGSHAHVHRLPRVIQVDADSNAAATDKVLQAFNAQPHARCGHWRTSNFNVGLAVLQSLPVQLRNNAP